MMWVLSFFIFIGVIYLWYYISKKYFDEEDILFSMLFTLVGLMLCVAALVGVGLGTYFIHNLLTNLLN